MDDTTIRASKMESQLLLVMKILSVIAWLAVPIYTLIVLLVVGSSSQDATLATGGVAGVLVGVVIGYLIYGLVFVGLYQLYIKAHLFGHTIQITAHQFPDIYSRVEDFSRKLGISVPKIFLMESGGDLNAFAMQLLGKPYVVIYSDVLELAYENGQDVVDFIIAHELAHVKLGHISFWKRLFLFPAESINMLGQAYRRSQEISCDRIAHILAPNAEERGLVLLASGKHLYRHVNTEVLMRDQRPQLGFVSSLIEFFSFYPTMMNRIYYCVSGYKGF
jgi:Zn-dependent protease with chaperone function